MSKFVDAYYRLLTFLIVATVVILLVPVALQIFSRFLFIWMVMLGAMVAVRDGSHFDVDVWPDLKPKANALLRLVSSCFVLVLALVFAWWGWQFTSFGWNQTSEIADLPMWLIFIAWPLLGVTWLLFVWEGWRRDLRLLAETGAAT